MTITFTRAEIIDILEGTADAYLGGNIRGKMKISNEYDLSYSGITLKESEPEEVEITNALEIHDGDGTEPHFEE